MIPRAIMMLPGVKKILFFLISLAMLRAIIIVAQTWGLTEAIVNLWKGEPLGNQAGWIILFFVCFLGGQVVASIQDKQLSSYALRRSEQLREELLHKIFVFGPSITQQRGTGNITTMVLDGIDQIETYIKLILPKIACLFVVPIILLVTVFVLDWISGLVLMLTVPVVIIFMIILGKTAQYKAAKQYKVFQLLSNHFIDSLRGIDTLKLFGISKQYSANVFKVSEQFRKATMETLRIVNLSSFSLDFFSTLSIAIVAVLLGVRLLDGSLFLFPALFSLILAPEFFRPIRDFAADYHASLDGKNALENIQEITETHPVQIVETLVPLWERNSFLGVRNLSFSLDGIKILHDISFEAQGFQKIGIIGMSGSGKTSLINILSGFALPDYSHIDLDNQMLPNFKQHDWQKQIVYIPQAPYIFHASLRENIIFYHPEATEKEVQDAITIAGLQELVKELPEGLETKIGEGARALSGGQAQRVALARAFIDKSRKVMLFDEPTAHLDVETEIELKENMLPLMENRLVFFATHRLHWMKEMDYVLVIDDGRIVESGTWAELSNRDGVFASFVRQSLAVSTCLE